MAPLYWTISDAVVLSRAYSTAQGMLLVFITVVTMRTLASVVQVLNCIMHTLFICIILACTKGSIRLWSAYATTPPTEGMLHYCHNSGEWKSMCKYRWDCLDAKVACRSLGFNGTLSKLCITESHHFDE